MIFQNSKPCLHKSRTEQIKDMKKENEALILRRKMIADGFNSKHLRIRNLKLQKLVDKTWTIVSTVEEGWWLCSGNTKISLDMHTLSFNVRSILSFERRTLFANSVHEGNYDIVCLTETWLVPEVPDGALFLTNHTVYRADRLSSVIKTKHGGVLIGITPSIAHELVQLDATFEDFLVIRVNASQHFLICCLYNSPVNSHFRWKRDKLIALLNELKCKQAFLDCKFVVITGDINFSKTSWESME